MEWGLEDGEDPDDLRLVKQANPAPWQTPEELRRRHDTDSMTPGQWKRMAAGMWTVGEESAFEPAQWDALRQDVGGVALGDKGLGRCARGGGRNRG